MLKSASLVAALCLFGCSSKPEVGLDAGPTQQRNTVTEAFAPVFCDRAAKCCHLSEFACVEAAAVELSQLSSDFGRWVDAGVVSIDAERAQDCRSEVAALPCDMSLVLLSFPACRAALVGHGKLGEAYPGYVGCVTGLECVLGQCAAAGSAGAGCDAGSVLHCLSGLCISPGCREGLMCLNAQCTPLGQIGDPCSPLGRKCSPYSTQCDCADPRFACQDGGVCAPLRPIDAGCVSNRQCSSGRCRNDLCSEVEAQCK